MNKTKTKTKQMAEHIFLIPPSVAQFKISEKNEYPTFYQRIQCIFYFFAIFWGVSQCCRQLNIMTKGMQGTIFDQLFRPI